MGGMRELPSAGDSRLHELIDQLSSEGPELARILAVSSYLVNERLPSGRRAAPGACRPSCLLSWLAGETLVICVGRSVVK